MTGSQLNRIIHSIEIRKTKMNQIQLNNFKNCCSYKINHNRNNS